MIDFFLDNFVWFLLPLILLQVLVWLVGKIKSRVASPANPPDEREVTAKKRKGFRRFLKENRIYFAIGSFCVGGIFALYKSPSFLSPTDPVAARNVYYFLIFIGANFATIIAVWRGRQFERQLQNSRFEKAVDMATDPGSKTRKGSGFLILKQMFFSSRKEFDDLMEENADVLTHLITQNFQMKDEQLALAEKLYKKNRVTYSNKDKDVNKLFAETQKPLIDKIALELCSGIANRGRGRQDDKNGKKRKGEITPSAFNYITNEDEYSLFIFPGIDLRNLKIFLLLDDGQVLHPEKEKQPNFKGCLIMRTEMRWATVDHVNFSESDLFRINCMRKEDSNMSCIGTRFDFANLIDCNFRGADFKDASFLGTNISGSDFSRAKNLTSNQFRLGAYWIRSNDSPFLDRAAPKFPRDDPNNFTGGFTDEFIESLARPAQDEEGKLLGAPKAEAAP